MFQSFFFRFSLTFFSVFCSFFVPFLSRMSPHQGTCRSEVAVGPVFQIWTPSKNFMVFLIETYQNQSFPASGAFFPDLDAAHGAYRVSDGAVFFPFSDRFFFVFQERFFSVFSPFLFRFLQRKTKKNRSSEIWKKNAKSVFHIY